MASENEKLDSLADICQKIRDAGIPDLADHIEAAWKRQMSQSWHHREMEELIARHEKEVAELRRKIGNAAKLREAAEAARDLILPQCNGGTAFARACGEVVNKIMSALAEPARNCDVGAVEEQIQRYSQFCRARARTKAPPMHGFEWEQMPYKSEGEEE